MEKEKELTPLTKETYRTNHDYMSYSRFSRFLACEAAAAANYYEPASVAQLIGSYVDAHFSNEMDEFKYVVRPKCLFGHRRKRRRRIPLSTNAFIAPIPQIPLQSTEIQLVFPFQIGVRIGEEQIERKGFPPNLGQYFLIWVASTAANLK